MKKEIGKLRKKVEIFEATVTVDDGMGGVEFIDQKVADVWADVEMINGTNDGKKALTLYNVTIRENSYPVLITDFLKYKGRKLKIREIVTDAKNELTIMQAWG
jgi:head-tail adaptor